MHIKLTAFRYIWCCFNSRKSSSLALLAVIVKNYNHMNSYPVENVWTDCLSLSQLMETGDLGEATAHAQWHAQAEQRYVQDYVTTRHQQAAEIIAPEVPRHQQRARSQLVQVRQHWLQLKMMRLQIWSCWKNYYQYQIKLLKYTERSWILPKFFFSNF